jgi:hypothetical protein
MTSTKGGLELILVDGQRNLHVGRRGHTRDEQDSAENAGDRQPEESPHAPPPARLRLQFGKN